MDLNGVICEVHCLYSDFIGSIKEQLREWCKKGPEEQQLLFAGRVLDNDKRISDYKIHDDNLIRLVVNLKGC
jgi:uncharacterized protein YciI